MLVDVATATIGPMDVRVEEDGKTRIRERYVVSTPLTGRLLRITFDVGDLVFADQTVLARMEPTDPALLDPRPSHRRRLESARQSASWKQRSQLWHKQKQRSISPKPKWGECVRCEPTTQRPIRNLQKKS